MLFRSVHCCKIAIDVDDLVRDATVDAPTIGMILCKSKKKTMVEYALRGVDPPPWAYPPSEPLCQQQYWVAFVGHVVVVAANGAVGAGALAFSQVSALVGQHAHDAVCPAFYGLVVA